MRVSPWFNLPTRRRWHALDLFRRPDRVFSPGVRCGWVMGWVPIGGGIVEEFASEGAGGCPPGTPWSRREQRGQQPRRRVWSGR